MPLIGLAHGSRHPGTAAAIDSLLASVAETLGIQTRAAYLDLVEPDLTTVAADLAAGGHDAAVVVPLLFTSAFHATVDVPAAITEAAAATGLTLTATDVLGTGADVEALLLDSLVAPSAVAPRDAAVLLYAVGSSRPDANAAVADLAARLATTRAGVVRHAFGTAEPRARMVLDELATLGRPVVVLPLFLAPGLLLDPILALAGERGWSVIAPIAERAAGLVARRYQDSAETVAGLR